MVWLNHGPQCLTNCWGICGARASFSPIYIHVCVCVCVLERGSGIYNWEKKWKIRLCRLLCFCRRVWRFTSGRICLSTRKHYTHTHNLAHTYLTLTRTHEYRAHTHFFLIPHIFFWGETYPLPVLLGLVDFHFDFHAWYCRTLVRRPCVVEWV